MDGGGLKWWRVCDPDLGKEIVPERQRLHTCVEGRYITLFRNNGVLSAIDSICHHAGGPLTEGPLVDIEDLNVTTVSCPWHNFLVSIDKGLKVFKGVEIVNGAPVVTGWKIGKMVQRCHHVEENERGIFVALQEVIDPCPADDDAKNVRCGQQFHLHPTIPTEIPPS